MACTLLLWCIVNGVAAVSADTGYFWHVTDFHWDFSYWTDQLSCNGMNVSDDDIFGNQWCDSPWKLVDETIMGIKNVKVDVDFMLWTGDTVPHVDSSHLSTDRNKELVRNVTELMKAAFPSVPIYATYGNHDYYKKDQFPPHGNDIYDATYLIWSQWINDSSQEHYFRKGGYYSILTRYGIRIVAMNSNMYYTKDKITAQLNDPADQFAWLDSVLHNASRDSEKVILTGHVPPGFTTPRAVRWMTEAFNKKFIEIVLRHSDVIVAMHFGHEHHDSFRLFYDKTGSPVVSLFIAPSVTPWRYQLPTGEVEPPHNPAARLVKYDRSTGRQLDIIQYYVDLEKATKMQKLTWELGYTATQMYGIQDITPKSMDGLLARMTSPTNKHFKSYVNWYNTNANTSNQYPCNQTCFTAVKCGARYLDEISFKICLSAGVNASVTVTCTWVFTLLCVLVATLTFKLC